MKRSQVLSLIVITASIGWERSSTKGKNRLCNSHRLKHDRVGCGEVMWSSVCWSANGALYTVFDLGGHAPHHLDAAPHSHARLTGGRERDGCKISLSKLITLIIITLFLLFLYRIPCTHLSYLPIRLVCESWAVITLQISNQFYGWNVQNWP